MGNVLKIDNAGAIGERSHRGMSLSRIIGTRKTGSRIGITISSRIEWTSRGFTAPRSKVSFEHFLYYRPIIIKYCYY